MATGQASRDIDIRSFVGAQDISSALDDGRLREIGSVVAREYEADKSAFAPRRERIDALYKLALQHGGQKDFPWQGAANVRFPILTRAAISFAAMVGPSIIKDEEVIRAVPVGSDDGEGAIIGPDGELIKGKDGKPELRNAGAKAEAADRVARFSSHQVLEEMETWASDTDRIMHILPIVGSCFRKIYFDAVLGRPESRIIFPQHLVLNPDAASLSSASRVSEELQIYPNEFREGVNLGVFRDIDLSVSQKSLMDPEDGGVGAGDVDRPHVFIEQHRTLDLDGDGYAEPYIVWLHEETGQIARIVARFDEEGIVSGSDGGVLRIVPEKYYTEYAFFPDPQGGPYGIGFGHLLEALNETVNTTINQLLDQGAMYTSGGGFIGAGLRLKGGGLSFRPNEWKRAESPGSVLRDSIVPLPVREPSVVVSGLMEYLIRAAEDMTTMTAALRGEAPMNAPATTMLASIEQGLLPFKAVFRRLHRSFCSEYRRLFYLNRRYLSNEAYSSFLGKSADVERDFSVVSVRPVSDPEMLNNMQNMMKAYALMEHKDDPLFDGVRIRELFVEALRMSGVSDLVQAPVSRPDPLSEAQLALLAAQVLALKSEAAAREAESARKDVQLKAEMETVAADVVAKKASAILSIARAEAEEEGSQLDAYEKRMSALGALTGGENGGEVRGDGGGVGGMEVESGYGGVLPVS